MGCEIGQLVGNGTSNVKYWKVIVVQIVTTSVGKAIVPSSSTVRIDWLSSFKLKISHMTGMTDSHGESTVSEIYFFDPIWKVKLGTHKCHGTESVQKKKKITGFRQRPHDNTFVWEKDLRLLV